MINILVGMKGKTVLLSAVVSAPPSAVFEKIVGVSLLSVILL
tara:strand:- start:24 stop:149 length:126 start_codon:yes stop_codon:yes gene_type:complete